MFYLCSDFVSQSLYPTNRLNSCIFADYKCVHALVMRINSAGVMMPCISYRAFIYHIYGIYIPHIYVMVNIHYGLSLIIRMSKYSTSTHFVIPIYYEIMI